MSLFVELKRRNVFRAGVAYIVAAWLIIQIIETIFPAFGFGDSAVRVAVIILAIGLIPALIFAWVFEFTSEGWKREQEIGHDQAPARPISKTLDKTIIAVLTVALVFFAIDEFVIEPGDGSRFDKSIAVLPFDNRSSIVDDIYFVDGIHDDILTLLANLSGLDKVISRTSMERYRDTAKSIPEIGEELDVANILEGGVQRAGNQVRINMQLIDARTDEHLWAKTYERELTAENLFAIQNEISREIVRALESALSDEDAERLDTIPTANLAAYDAFVLGRQELVERTAEGVQAAKAHFERAIELDPNYALAYVGLADSYALTIEYVGIDKQSTFAPRQAAIDRALDLNPRSGEAYTSLASLRKSEDRMAESEEYFLKAIELSPNYATAYHWYFLILRDTGREEEAVLQIRKALELDPGAPVLAVNLINMLRRQGKMEEALAAALDGVKRSPGYAGFYTATSAILEQQGQLAEALRWALGARAVAPMNPSPRFYECDLYLYLGDDGSAESCIEEIRQDFPQIPESAVASLVGQLFSLRGQNQEAVDYARNLLEEDQQNIGLRYNLAYRYATNLQLDESIKMYQELAPAYFSDDDIVIDRSNYSLAMMIGILLYADGDLDRANQLMDGALAAMRTMHRTRGNGYTFSDVLIHAIRRDSQSAIAGLREAIDDGWRTQYWYLRHSLYDPMRTEPEWNALVDEVEADIFSQRAWFEEHKDEPLF